MCKFINELATEFSIITQSYPNVISKVLPFVIRFHRNTTVINYVSTIVKIVFPVMYVVVRLFFENVYGLFEPMNTGQWVYRWNGSTTNQGGRQYETPPAAADDGNLYRCCYSPPPVHYRQLRSSTLLHIRPQPPLTRLLTGAIITLTRTCVGEVIDRRTFKSFGCVRGYYHYYF